MKKYTFWFLVMVSTTLSGVVTAGENLSGQHITSVGNGWGDAQIFVRSLEADVASGEGCNTSDVRYVLSPNHPGYDAIVSILLSALHSGKPVEIYISGCTSQNLMSLQAATITQ